VLKEDLYSFQLVLIDQASVRTKGPIVIFGLSRCTPSSKYKIQLLYSLTG
jgi:hypothetical protein